MVDEVNQENDSAGTDVDGAVAGSENSDNSAENKKKGNLADVTKNSEADKEQKEDAGEGKDNADGDRDEVDYSQIEMPEGFEVNQELMAEFSPVLKEMGASKEHAGKIAALGAKLVQQTLDGQRDAWDKQVDAWEKEVRADPEIGSDEAIAVANRAVKKFGSEKMQNELLRLGIGNHPELVRCFYNIGTMISDDSLVVSSKSSVDSKTLGEVLYGDRYDKRNME